MVHSFFSLGPSCTQQQRPTTKPASGIHTDACERTSAVLCSQGTPVYISYGKKKKPCEQLSIQFFAQLTSNQWPSSFLETQLLFGAKTCSFPAVFSSASFHPWGSHHHHLWRIGTLPTGALRAGLRASQAFHRT